MPDRPLAALIFPPLVESNFGTVYPSLPVLAGFLKSNGIGVHQLDLNEEFAEFLLSREVLSALAAGTVPGITESPAQPLHMAAARWSLRYPDTFIDANGSHRFGADRVGTENPFAYVPELLAQPFSVDPDLNDVANIWARGEVIDFYRRFYGEVAVEDRVPEGCRIVGISIPMGPQLVPGLALAEYLKERHPTVKVVVGGPTLSLLRAELLETLLARNTAVDCVVRYDGEIPLLSLCDQISRNRWEPEAVPGVSFLTEGRITHNAPAPGLVLDRIPPPLYTSELLSKLAEPVLGITQARGCYWGKCDYCDFVEVYEGSPSFRGRKPEPFVDEICHLVERTGVRRYRFITESIPPAFARRMSLLLLERKVGIRWSSFAMVDRRFDRELLGLMVDAGCEFLVVGLETMNTRVLKAVHKSADRAENIRFLCEAKEVGLKVRINLIPDLPSTSYEEALCALDDIKELRDCLDDVTIFRFEATLSSGIGRDPERFGLIPLSGETASGQAQYALNHLTSIDPAMTAQEHEKILELYAAFALSCKRGFIGRLCSPDEIATVRVPCEEFDMVQRDDAIDCVNFLTRERFRVPRQTTVLVRQHLDGQPFPSAEFFQELGGPQGKKLISHLMSVRFLVPAAKVSLG
jgi:hypothetical protein